LKEKLWGIQKMGNLNPGTTYIYERDGDKIYARESGKSQRIIVGYDADVDPERKRLAIWNDILKEAETNLALQKAVDRVILIYQTVKDHE